LDLSSTNKAFKTLTRKMITWLDLTLQDRASPAIEQLIFFHDHALIIILIIITTVFYAMIRIVQNKQTRQFILEGQLIETIWTTAPAVILVFIAIPSLRLLLYLIDEIHNPVITLMNISLGRGYRRQVCRANNITTFMCRLFRNSGPLKFLQI